MGLRKKRIANSGNPCYNPQCVRSKDDAPTLGCRQAVRHQTLTLTFVGSNPAIPAKYDPLAQSAEQLPFKQWVRGSNPRRVTKKTDILLGICLFAVGDSENQMGQSGETVPDWWLDASHSLRCASHSGNESPAGHQTPESSRAFRGFVVFAKSLPAIGRVAFCAF